MTQWGMLLLCAYIALGVSRTSWRKAGRLVVLVTAGVITVVVVSYVHGTPKYTFVPRVDANVYIGGQPTNNPSSDSTEDTSGVTLMEIAKNNADAAAAQAAAARNPTASGGGS